MFDFDGDGKLDTFEKTAGFVAFEDDYASNSVRQSRWK